MRKHGSVERARVSIACARPERAGMKTSIAPADEQPATVPTCSASSECRGMKTLLLFIATALAEIVGCYLPYQWLKQGRSIWLLIPAAASLALFAWLLTLHETAAGRVYAAYGGVYIGVALLWLWTVDGIRPTVWDATGVAVALTGMSIIMFQPRT
jgi:small multidrug resistance family-3 protein